MTGASTEAATSTLSERVDRAQDAALSRFGAALTLDADRAHCEELGHQARPLLERALEAGSSEDREAAALAHLLGRRAGALRLTPTGALALAGALGAALEDAGIETRPVQLRARMMEGFHAATEERALEAADRRAAEVVPIIALGPRCYLVAIAGEHGGRALAETVDAIGRRLLDGDAAACAIDLSQLARPDGAVMRQVVALHHTCRMLGVRSFVSGLRVEARDAAVEANVDLSELATVASLDLALAAALEASGLELVAASAIGRALRRFGIG